MSQQFRLFFLHLIIVICWNFQVGCDLPVGDLVNVQRFHNLPSLVVQMQVRPSAIRFHLQAFGIYQIVLLDLILPLKFCSKLLQTHPFFHIFTSLLRFFYQEIRMPFTSVWALRPFPSSTCTSLSQ